MIATQVPGDLAELNQWVLWSYDDKHRKIPYQPNGRKAASDKPNTWTDLQTALANIDSKSGIGFVFHQDDPYCGVDLDDCLENGELKPWATEIVRRMGGTYGEISPSGTGIKFWVRASIPAAKKFPYHDGAIEIYSSGRYFCFTGNRWPTSTMEIEECQTTIDWLLTLNPKKTNGPLHLPPQIQHGTQHNTLISYAASLWAKNLDPDEVRQLTIAASKRCEIVPPEENVLAIANWIIENKRRGKSDDFLPPDHPPELIGFDWKSLLHTTGTKKEPRPVLINADIAIRYSPEWEGVLAFDEFKQKVRVVKTPPIGGDVPRDWSDVDDTKATVWMQTNGIYIGQNTLSNAIVSAAKDNTIHAVREYLNKLQWDGQHRVDTWLQDFMGAEVSPYTSMIGRRWLIAAVARVMAPGCQADYMLVLEGEQGTKKSTALKTLASQDWFCDHTPDLHDKDSQMQLFGSWIIEWGELAALRRSDVTAVKAFITRRVEKLRPPYARYVIEVPRQCIFAGTTNERNWLKDETGGRRFWPVWCNSIDIDGLERFRDQLWAEAVTLYTDGAIWWPDTPNENAILAEQQESRMDSDPWQEKIAEYVSPTMTSAGKSQVTISDILSDCLGMSVATQQQADKNRAGRIMKALGWNYVKERIPGTKNEFFSGYKKPD